MIILLFYRQNYVHLQYNILTITKNVVERKPHDVSKFITSSFYTS